MFSETLALTNESFRQSRPSSRRKVCDQCYCVRLRDYIETDVSHRRDEHTSSLHKNLGTRWKHTAFRQAVVFADLRHSSCRFRKKNKQAESEKSTKEVMDI